MRVVVATASKHGATAEIGKAIADVLAARGLDARPVAVEAMESIDDFDACVVGSAVYAGHWLVSATEFVSHNAVALAARPVWLFSSGPIGEPPRPEEDPVDAEQMIETARARDHRVFPGRLDKERLSFAERAVVLAFRAPYGDFRDWAEIRAWAEWIADSLASLTQRAAA